MEAKPLVKLSALEYTDGKTLLAHGTEALHDHFAARAEAAMGKALPQMEVRFSNVTLLTERTVTVNQDGKHNTGQELPTLANVLVKQFVPSKAGNQRTVRKHILKNVSGVLKPGTMTLILGQPGSGKSSLMKLLSGRFPMTKNIVSEGEVTYNGMTSSEVAQRLPQLVSYVTQRDNHFPTLTVQETLKFAHECCGAELGEHDEHTYTEGTADENKAALDAARAMHKYFPEIVTQQLGLEGCQYTIVGDGMLRGISGGERKRVTTGEMEMGNQYVTLMDEISTGLDSAATYDIVKTQCSIAKKLRKTVVIALLQPAPEVFELFDNVMLLNQGRVMYNGPREDIVPYFERLGFYCPSYRDVADFLLDLGTEQQIQYEAGDGSPPPRSSRDFANRFLESNAHQATLQSLAAPVDPVLLHDVTHHFNHVPEFHQSFWASTWTLMKREVKVASRNKAFLIGRVVIVVGMGLMYSLLFYQFDAKNVQVVFGTIFPAIMFFALGQSTQVPLFLEAREIFYKQRAANFYRTSAYVLATSVSQIPMAMVETLVYSTLVYWMTGFSSEISAFFTFELVLFVSSLAFSAWFFFLSALLPNVHIAESVGLMSLLVYILFAGFMITQHEIPVYFKWAFWLNPVAWSFRSLAINQYQREEFDVCDYGGIRYCEQYNKTMGVFSLEAYQIDTESYWVWYGILFLAASFVVYMTIAVFILENVRHQAPINDAVNTREDDDRVVLLSTVSIEDTYDQVMTPREMNREMVVLEVQDSLRDRDFVPVTLTFKDLWYTVPDPSQPNSSLELLKGISGFASPGTMTALMGSSGAGKTTLMDVIAGRKSEGSIRGEILLNGHPATELAIQRATGYCEQTDIHSEAATIREALMFSAFLRMGSEASDGKKIDSVEDCLDLLDLRPIADQIIRGSSVEQMKRLSIGVELAAQPSVLFLDEPTSGLDARSAKIIMEGVRKVAYTGRTVVCTIHQPSQEVFGLFDSLLLLKRGGETVYFGDLGNGGSELVKYFESIPGTPRFVTGYNPATWMLEAIGAGVDASNPTNSDFVAAFNASLQKTALDTTLANVMQPIRGVGALVFDSKRASPAWMQAKLLTTRFLKMYWRSPAYNLTRFVVMIVLAVIFSLSFRNMDYESYQGINAAIGMVFTVVVFISIVAFKAVKPITLEDRAAFYRERASQTYNTFWYFMGNTVAEIPYVFSSTFVFTAIFFPIVGLTGAGPFFIFWLNLALMVLLHVYLGQLLVYVLPSLEVATVAGVMVISVFFMFAGFNPPPEVIPVGYQWLYHATPPKYTFAVITSVLFGQCSGPDFDQIGCKRLTNVPPPLPEGISVKQYLESVFWVKHDELEANIAITLALIVIIRVLALLALRFISYQKR